MLATMNVLRERYQFHHRQQKPHESIEQFAAEIRRLAASCQFSALEESLIRDHVLFGLRNQKTALQVIEKGGDPSLFEIIDICSRSGRCARMPRQHTSGHEILFEGVEVKNEPFEENIEVLPIILDKMPEVDDALPAVHLHQETKTDNAEVINYAALIDEPQSPQSFAESGPLAYVKVEVLETDRISSTSRKSGTNTRTVKPINDIKLEGLPSSSEKSGRPKCTRKLQELAPSHTQRPTSSRSMHHDQWPRTFKKKNSYRRHVMNTLNRASCRFCRKEFKNHVTMDHHLKAYHPETIKGNEGRQYECYVCHREMKSIPKLRQHFIEHFRVKNYLCPQCGYIAGTRQNLEKHLMRNDHNTSGAVIKPFKCDICGQAFVTRYTLGIHKTSHSDVRNFPCPICGKLFKNQKNLGQHKIRHGEKTHQCQLCSYSCFSAPSLNLHMKVHTGGS